MVQDAPLAGERGFEISDIVCLQKCAVIKVKPLPPNKHLSAQGSRRRSGLNVTKVDIRRLDKLPMSPWGELGISYSVEHHLSRRLEDQVDWL